MSCPRQTQGGYTLIELLVAMAVMSAVFAGLGGIVFAVNNLSQAWDQRVRLAQVTPPLANSLEADAHRYVPCGQGAELDLCLPGRSSPSVRYSATAATCEQGPGWDLTRTEVQSGPGPGTAVARCLQVRPSFAASCSPPYLQVQGLQYPGDKAVEPGLFVYFRAPSGACS